MKSKTGDQKKTIKLKEILKRMSPSALVMVLIIALSGCDCSQYVGDLGA